jgi:SAM-dependent methyltransferase
MAVNVDNELANATKGTQASAQRSREVKLRENLMHPIRWVDPACRSFLDVGCNVGELLSHCRQLYPEIRLGGVEINAAALDAARRRLPEVELHLASATELPFADESFECVACIEVLEHVPPELRARALAELHRVLAPGGRLVLRVPHAGAFAWLDPNNFRFRLPGIYAAVVGRGRRDSGYDSEKDLVWHHHFSRSELIASAGEGWSIEAARYGGLLLQPLADIASWFFYRSSRTNSHAFRFVSKIGDFDLGCDWGRASYDLLLVLRRL